MPVTLEEVQALMASTAPSSDAGTEPVSSIADTMAGQARAGVSTGLGVAAIAQNPLVQDVAAGLATELVTPMPPQLKGIALGARALQRVATGALASAGVESLRQAWGKPTSDLDARDQDAIQRDLDSAFQRGAVGEALSLGLGAMGGAAWRLFDRHGLSLLATMSPNVGSGIRVGVRKLLTGKSVTDDLATAEVFNAFADTMARDGTITAAEKQLLSTGAFDTFADHQLNKLASHMAGKVDPAAFAKLAASHARGQLDLASAVYERGINTINAQVGGTVAKTQAVAPIMGRSTPMMQVTGGIPANIDTVRDAASKIQFAAEAAPGSPLAEIQGLTSWLTNFQGPMPYLQLDQARKNVGAALGVVRRGKGADPAYDAIAGSLKQLYGSLTTAQVQALKSAGRDDLASQFVQLTNAYKNAKNTYGTRFMRKLGQAVDPQGATDVAAGLAPLKRMSADELQGFFQTVPSQLRNRYRGWYLDDMLFRRSTIAKNGIESIDGNKLIKLAGDEAERLRAMFPDVPDIVPTVQKFGAAIAGPEAMSGALRNRAIEMNSRGVTLNVVRRGPSGKNTVQFQVPREALANLLGDARGSQALLRLYGGKLARGTRSGALRNEAVVGTDPVLDLANAISESMLLNTTQAQGAAESAAADGQ